MLALVFLLVVVQHSDTKKKILQNIYLLFLEYVDFVFFVSLNKK